MKKAPGVTRAPHTVARFLPYWEPPDFSGTRTHNWVLPEISRLGGIFIEAPVPNADRFGPGYDKRGAADLYDAATTVGVFFAGDNDPRGLGAPSRLLHGGNRYPHQRQAAPAVDGLRNVVRVDHSPSSIQVGDLKPSHGTIEALEGTGQLRNYLSGFELARHEVNELAGNGATRPAGVRWDAPSLGVMGRNRLEQLVPEQFRPSVLVRQNPQGVVLKQNGGIVRPPVRAQGRLAVAPDPTNDGILNYVWVPDAVRAPALPPEVARLGQEVIDRLMHPLREPPVRQQRTGTGRRFVPLAQQTVAGSADVALDGPAHHPSLPTGSRSETPAAAADKERLSEGAPRALHRVGPRIQRQQRDAFDLSRWQSSHRELRQRFTSVERAPEVQDPRQAPLVVEAHEAIQTEAGLQLPAVPAQLRQVATTIERVEFWTSQRATVLGRFRQLFGGLFVRVANAYERIRDRFASTLRRRPRPGGGGLVGAAVKAVFSGMKMAGLVVIRQTVQVLQSSLVRGVSEKLRELVGGERIAELQERIESIEQLREELETQATHTADHLVESTFGPYARTIEELDRVREIVGDITSVVNMVRWAARAVACVSPPAVGCLWGLAQGILEQVAAEIVGSCWFQEKIRPLILQVSWIRQLPNRIATLILDTIRERLPVGLRSVLAEVEGPEINAEEIDCESEGSARTISDSQQAVLRLQERLGEERFLAFLELARRGRIPPDSQLTEQMAERIATTIESMGVTAEDLQRYAQMSDRDPTAVPPLLRELLDQSGASAIPAPTPDVISDGGQAEADNSGVSQGRPSPGQIANPEEMTWNVRVLAGVGRSDPLRSTVNLTVQLSTERQGRQITIQVSPLTARVVEHTFIGSEQARVLVITLEVVHDSTFDLSPPPAPGVHQFAIAEGARLRHPVAAR